MKSRTCENCGFVKEFPDNASEKYCCVMCHVTNPVKCKKA